MPASGTQVSLTINGETVKLPGEVVKVARRRFTTLPFTLRSQKLAVLSMLPLP